MKIHRLQIFSVVVSSRRGCSRYNWVMSTNLEGLEAFLNILSYRGELVPRLYLQTQLY